MSKFDTHGGYFAPEDYTRINEGGSHEENPNGGVQLGVDEQGIPNMVEEGEPVYKDFVFSDNIKASLKFLEANGIPKRYEGMLYSEIADSFFSEAEDRPYDPVSRNGLEAMLGRIADAQEQQKQDSERRKIERELKKLSPEELDALEQELMAAAQPQAEEAVPQPEVAEPIPAEAMPMEQAPVEQEEQPMMPMSLGGLLKRFDEGGPFDDEPDNPPFAVRDNTMTNVTADNGYIPARTPEYDAERGRASLENQSMVPYLGLAPNAVLVGDYIDEGDYGNAAYEAAMMGLGLIPGGAVAGRMIGRALKPVGRTVARGARAIGRGMKNIPKTLLEIPGRNQMLGEAFDAVHDARAIAKTASQEADDAAKRLKELKATLRKDIKAGNANPELAEQIQEMEKVVAESDAKAIKASANATKETLKSLNTAVGSATLGPLRNRKAYEDQIAGLKKAYDAAEAELKKTPRSKAKKAALDKAKEELDKAQSFKNEWIKHGEWPVKAAIGASAAATGLYWNNQRKTNNWLDSQFEGLDDYADGGLINKYPIGGPIGRNPWRILDLDEAAHNETYHDILDWQPAFNNSVVRAHYLRNDSPAIISYPAPKTEDDSLQFNDEPQVSPYNWVYNKWATEPMFNGVSRNYLFGLPTSGTVKNTPTATTTSATSVNDTTTTQPKPTTSSTGTGRGTGVKRTGAPADVPMPDLSAASAAIDREILGQLPSIQKASIPNLPDASQKGIEVPKGMPNRAIPSSDTNDSGDGYGSPYFPTFPRYAGAIGSGILGIYNALQRPDRYTRPRINPYVPEGHINLQNERYMPVDQNMIQNQMLAQGNSTQRALNNSGLGPSTAAAILAADNNTTRNLGTGFLQSWQANNQQRNSVLAANNQAEAQRAQFDYGVDAARQRALSMAELANAQNDLTVQRLNYQSEADKYNALGNQIRDTLEALSGIGRENFILNQINSNTNNEGYKAGANGVNVFLPFYGRQNTNVGACGGFLKKYKK